MPESPFATSLRKVLAIRLGKWLKARHPDLECGTGTKPFESWQNTPALWIRRRPGHDSKVPRVVAVIEIEHLTNDMEAAQKIYQIYSYKVRYPHAMVAVLHLISQNTVLSDGQRAAFQNLGADEEEKHFKYCSVPFKVTGDAAEACASALMADRRFLRSVRECLRFVELLPKRATPRPKPDPGGPPP